MRIFGRWRRVWGEITEIRTDIWILQVEQALTCSIEYLRYECKIFVKAYITGTHVCLVRSAHSKRITSTWLRYLLQYLFHYQNPMNLLVSRER